MIKLKGSAMEERAELQEASDVVFVPNGIVSGFFTQYVFDNLDFNYSTVEGMTLRATTHNIYQ